MDYTREAILEELAALEIQQKAEVMEMMKESEYLQACYENQVVGLMEAKGDGVLAGIVRATQAMFSRVTGYFRKAAIHKFEKRFDKESVKKIRENLDKVKQNANNLAAQKMTPYWDADYNKDKSNISTAMKTAFTNVENGNYDDYSFASKFIKNTQLVKDRDTDVKNYLLNYFRCNNNDMPNVETVTVTGKEIAGHVEAMLNYIENFSGAISALPGQVSDAYNNAVKNVKSIVDQVSKPVTQEEIKSEAETGKVEVKDTENKPDNTQGKAAVPESVTYQHITPNTYFAIENKLASETMLPFFMGYPVTEEEKPQSATAIVVADKNANTGNATTGDTGAKDDKTKDENAKRKEYFNRANSFFELVLTAYQTTIEERFVVYSKLINMIAGEYITVSKEQSEKADKKDKDLYNKTVKVNRKKGKKK